jgi:hypothetical protein
MNVIDDTVQSRRLVARSLVPSNVKALEIAGLEVSNLDGIEYRVAGRVAFFPKNGFWRFIDGSRQGYGASRLIPALAEPAPIDPMIAKLRKPRRNSEKPVTGRDSARVELETTELHQCAESVTGPRSSTLLPGVWP